MKTWNIRRIVLQVAAIIFAFAVLNETAAKPLRVSAVLIHELGHAGVAKALGNEVVRVGVSPEEESGYVEWSGGSAGAVGVAGYLTSALVGAWLLIGSGRRSRGRFVCALVGTFAVAASYLPLDTSAVIYIRWIIAVVAAIFFLAFVAWLMAAVILRLVGTYWCLYAFFDLLDDCILRSDATRNGDPVEVANALAVDVRCVGVLMFVAVLGIVAWAMVQSVRGDPQRSPFILSLLTSHPWYATMRIFLCGNEIFLPIFGTLTRDQRIFVTRKM